MAKGDYVCFKNKTLVKKSVKILGKSQIRSCEKHYISSKFCLIILNKGKWH